MDSVVAKSTPLAADAIAASAAITISLLTIWTVATTVAATRKALTTAVAPSATPLLASAIANPTSWENSAAAANQAHTDWLQTNQWAVQNAAAIQRGPFQARFVTSPPVSASVGVTFKASIATSAALAAGAWAKQMAASSAIATVAAQHTTTATRRRGHAPAAPTPRGVGASVASAATTRVTPLTLHSLDVVYAAAATRKARNRIKWTHAPCLEAHVRANRGSQV